MIFSFRKPILQSAALIMAAGLFNIPLANAATAKQKAVSDPDGMLHLVVAPARKFEGRIFLINDWNGGDKDNQNAGEELNTDSLISKDVTPLGELPGSRPDKVRVKNIVLDPKVLADASQRGKIAIAMGAHSRHVLAWLTRLPANAYNYNNITVVTHSNWNELDGKRGYEANKKAGDPPLKDTHGVGLRRGLYANLARISDLGVTIWEIPRTDLGEGGWGGKVDVKGKKSAGIKSLDISDLGLIHYLKTGILEATREQRNAYVSDDMKKPENLKDLKTSVLVRYWDNNTGVPGKKEDYLYPDLQPKAAPAKAKNKPGDY